ncbi:MAG: hypothetical protein K2L27_06210 [Muribaculaceae bacterium]|nr:hypothetical protein [Muribaculaceae bacterium]
MKQLFAAATLALVLCSTAFSAAAQRRRPMNEEERLRWRTEMRNYKHEFLAKELELTREQQREFFPLYDEMDDAIERINTETRELEREVSTKADASDVELEAAARAVFSQKQAESEVEQSYFDRFKQVLKPRQLLQLRQTERRFTQRLMRHHNRARNQAAEK